MAKAAKRRTAAVSVRELSRNTSRVLDAVRASESAALVTSRGRIVAAIIPMDGQDLEDYVLSRAQEFMDSMREADEAIATGRTRDARDVFAELEQGGKGSTSFDLAVEQGSKPRRAAARKPARRVS